ncbi:MAG: UPF0262 family protein [Alphaproteobacteria bacterium]|nr:UPF0262 family protein [Alphaproteobacteria bacterium]
MTAQEQGTAHKVIDIVLDEANIVRLNADIDHERRVAIFDLLEENYFEPVGSPYGPYRLHLLIADNRLVFDVRREDDSALGKVMLSLSPFRRIVKDYFTVCDSYFDAIKHAPPSQIEAIDMGRRGLHNDGADMLRERLTGKIEIDDLTSRRLFTLICVLHIRA